MKAFLFPTFVIFCTLFLTNCQQGGSSASTAVPPNLTGFTMTPIAGGAGQKAVKKNGAGAILEEGILINGAKNGSWVTYHPNKEMVLKTQANYVNNELNGVFLTYSDRGQIETLTTYANGVFDGNYAKFRFGNLEESGTYSNGQLNGVYKKYYPSRKIQMEAEYKNGQQHGFYKYYDEEGKIVMEYEYKDGEKVSGGLTQ